MVDWWNSTGLPDLYWRSTVAIMNTPVHFTGSAWLGNHAYQVVLSVNWAF